jgi:hypothetical protein
LKKSQNILINEKYLKTSVLKVTKVAIWNKKPQILPLPLNRFDCRSFIYMRQFRRRILRGQKWKSHYFYEPPVRQNFVVGQKEAGGG